MEKQDGILTIDNPGGTWLADQVADCIDAGSGQWGQPSRFGPITAYFDRPMSISVAKLSKLSGCRAEQDNVRIADLNALIRMMRATGKMPLIQDRKDQEQVPLILVDYKGKAWVTEGNHRIMAAERLDWIHLPVEIRYFSGGEAVVGDWAPDRVIALDRSLRDQPRIEVTRQTDNLEEMAA